MNIDLDGDGINDDPWDFGNGMQYPMLKYDGMSVHPQGGQAMGVPDNWNAPVVGERVSVCLTPDDFPNRARVSGQTYYVGWVWESSANGDTWTPISGAGDDAPTYEYVPASTDVGSYLRAKMELTDGSTAYTRALGGRVVAASSATAAATEIPFVRGHAAPQVGSEIVARNPIPRNAAANTRVGWQRCENNTAPFNCETILEIPGVWWINYTPAADAGKYLRMYAYYETAAGVWTRRMTDFTVGVVATTP